MSIVPRCQIERLDVPAKKGLWRVRQALSTPAARRLAFLETMSPRRLSDNVERLARLRTLVDLGLWSDVENVGKNAKKIEVASEKVAYFQKEVSSQVASFWRPNDDQALPVLWLALEAGMDPNIKANFGYIDTPLVTSTRGGDIQQVELLLRAGANPNQINDTNETPLVVCCEGMHDAPEPYQKIALLLIEHGADVNSAGEGPNKEKRNAAGDLLGFSYPLLVALRRGHTSVASWFLDHGADPHVCSSKDNALHVCPSHSGKNSDMIRRLVEAGVDINQVGGSNCTPLMGAVIARDMDKALLLIESGARIDIGRKQSDSHGKPGSCVSLPEALMTWNPLTSKSLAVFQRIQEAHPDFWAWPASDGKSTVAEAIASGISEFAKQWAPVLESAHLQQAIDPVPQAATRRSLRL